MAIAGFQNLHPDVTLNFMMNRMSRDIAPEELKSFGKNITTLDGWTEAALTAGEASEVDGRFKEAAAWFRGAEFFLAPDHGRKLEAFDRFMAGFNKARPDISARRAEVPYEGGILPTIDLPAAVEERDVIVACSGFDGLIEEMLATMEMLAAGGYRVILYAGPGQGAALRRSHLTMPMAWEKPVAAVLDHFDIRSCTLLGVSLGGYLAPRAAAFEPRAKRLIAWGPMYDFFGCAGRRMDAERFEGLKQLLEGGERDIVNELVRATMEVDTTARWGALHGMHVSGKEDPFGFYTWMQTLNLRDVSDRITQDTLILGGSKDHLVPLQQLWQQAAALGNARSVTTRLFTEHENASEHCQVTNPEIVIREILGWLERTGERSS